MKEIKQEDYLNQYIKTNEYILSKLKTLYDKLTIDMTELSDVLNFSKRTILNKL